MAPDAPPPAPPPPAPDVGRARNERPHSGPRHTLGWLRRIERRSILSLAKRCASPRTASLAARVPAIGIAARRFLSRVERAHVVVCGAPFRLDVMRRSVSRSVFLGGRWHTPVVAMLREHVKPGMTALDIGANVGFMAVHMADRAGPDGTVLAFEPEPRNFAILATNARHARYRNIVPFSSAIGDAVGSTVLWLSPRDGGDHRTVASEGRQGVPIEVTTVDHLAAERKVEIHFVKMDIQGAEAAALRGMVKTMSAPAFQGLVLEFWPAALRAAHEDPVEVLEGVRRAGLRCVSHPAVESQGVAAFVGSLGAKTSTDMLFLRS
jgi:FkbM family methyltransferase